MTSVLREARPAKVGGAFRKWSPVFLASFRLHGNYTAAARAAGVDRKTVWNWAQRSPQFKARIAAAYEESTDILEAKAFDRATKDSSDTVLMFLLRSRRPDQFKDVVRQEHVTPPESGPMTFTLKIGRDDDDGTPALSASPPAPTGDNGHGAA